MTKNNLPHVRDKKIKPTGFEPGDILKLTPATRTFGAPTGSQAVVTDRGIHWSEICKRWLVDVKFDFVQLPGGYDLSDFENLSRQPKPVEPSAPMTKAVLDLLRTKGALTSMEAQGVLRCRSLSKRVTELKALGHKIVRELKEDTTGQRYARYHLLSQAA